MDSWVELALRSLATCMASVQSCATVIALIVGGIWTYKLFIQRRQRFPRATVEHHVTERDLPGEKRLLRVVTKITNTGEVLLSLETGRTWIQQVLPVPKDIADQLERHHDPVEAGETQIQWPLIGEREIDWSRSPCEIEPGETDELHFDFVVGSKVQTVEIYSYLENVQKRDRTIGWTVSTIHDTGKPHGGEE